MKLSPRLSAICDQVQNHSQALHDAPIDNIWDCCCDHGYLGQHLLTLNPESTVHFVDVVPHLMAELESELNSQQYNSKQVKNWAVHCMDAARIKLNAQQSNLIIIAGVGGDLLLKMVETIVQNNPNQAVEFILCPVRQLHTVREGLQHLKLGLVGEKIVKDKSLFYEIIHVSNQSNSDINLVGDVMWDLTRAVDQEYRQLMMSHYQKQPSERGKKLLKAYYELHQHSI